MQPRYLLDTNVISELTKLTPHRGVTQAIATHEAVCAIGSPTLEELRFGWARLQSGARKTWLGNWLDDLFDKLPILAYDAEAANWLGLERARLTALGRAAPRTDGEIAAIAATNGLILVTRNRKDFKGYTDLLLEDWHAAKVMR
jgi:tRNA(fMet)-specific endonuclease VapC